jgi:predicted O-methyltransferase YrrM
MEPPRTTDLTVPAEALSFVREAEVPYFVGAIFPSEMALFLHECARARVDAIVESGRQDGYSTALIARYGESQGVAAISIDYEDAAYRDRAIACRQRLSPYRALRIEAGDAFVRLPAVLKGLEACRIALLIDGPKGHEAVYLSAAACALAPIAVVAHHNTAPDTPWYPHFSHRFPDPRRVEGSALPRCPGFSAFREWERTQVAVDRRGLRDVEQTSLACSVLTRPTPSRLYLSGPSPGFTLRAWVCRTFWQLGRPGGTRALRWLWRLAGHRQ